MSKFDDLLAINVNDKLEQRKGDGGKELSYLSWAFAWSEFKKVYPDAKYEIKKFKTYADDDKNIRLLPYMYDENTGYMVQTSVTADDLTYEMWLPVMNSSNKAMKAEPYEYTTKYGTKAVEAATMFDVNKAIMRCLVKNLAMFGLGLYLYAGEDLPDDMKTINPEEKAVAVKTLADEIVECKDEDKLTQIYQANKKIIQNDRELLELITNQGRILKGLVA